jgi:tRNA G18 (ribose-2'-O)-methylase SpoU
MGVLIKSAPHFFLIGIKMLDTRNIIDFFKYWEVDAIKTNLDEKRHNFSILISNQFNDFNIGSVIRNSNAFLAKEVIIYGRKQFDKRGTVGTHIYENLHHIKFIDDLVLPENSLLIGIDNIDGSHPIETFQYPKDQHIVFAFGQEQVGLPKEIIDLCDHLLYIKQYGSVRSINVGVASGIVMYDYCSKMI